MTSPRIVLSGDAALLVEYEARIDPLVNTRAVALADALRIAAIPGVSDIVPAFRSVTVYFDPLRTDVAAVHARIHACAALPDEVRVEGSADVEIPVCYDLDLAPDLEAVARASGLHVDDVVAAHAARTYRVYMLGFMPGFAYLGVVDSRIAVPRRAVPRTRVPAGAVGIAGEQTGVYPSSTPGGWNLIGQTPLAMLVVERETPSLLNPGQTVRFRPIDRHTFDTWQSSGGGR